MHVFPNPVTFIDIINISMSDHLVTVADHFGLWSQKVIITPDHTYIYSTHIHKYIYWILTYPAFKYPSAWITLLGY